MVWLIVVVVAALIVWFVVRSKSRWKTVDSGIGQSAEKVEAKHAYLKSNQIKCRLRALDTGGNAVNASAGYNGGIKLEVHETQLEQATDLLKQFKE